MKGYAHEFVSNQLAVLEREIGKVGLPGVEPGTSRLSGARSNRLSYKPTKRKDAHEKTVSLWKENWIGSYSKRLAVGFRRCS